MNPITFKFWGGEVVPLNLSVFQGGQHLFTDFTGNSLFLQTKNTTNLDTYVTETESAFFSSDDLSTFTEIGNAPITSPTTLSLFVRDAKNIRSNIIGMQSYSFDSIQENAFVISKTAENLNLSDNTYFLLPVVMTNDALPETNWGMKQAFINLSGELLEHYNYADPDFDVDLNSTSGDDQFTATVVTITKSNNQVLAVEGFGTKNLNSIYSAPAKGDPVEYLHPDIQTVAINGITTSSEVPINVPQVYPVYSRGRLIGSYNSQDYYSHATVPLAAPASELFRDNTFTTKLWATPQIVHTFDDDGTYTYNMQLAAAHSGQMKELSLNTSPGSYLSGTYYMWDISENGLNTGRVRFLAGTGNAIVTIHADGHVKRSLNRGSNFTEYRDTAFYRSTYDTLYEILDEIKAEAGTASIRWQGNCITTPSGKILFMPATNYLVYSEDFGLNWSYVKLNSSIYGMQHAHEKSDGSIYVTSSGSWTFYKVHDGTSWLGDKVTTIFPTSQGYGGNVWNTGLFWFNETETRWYFLGNGGQGFTVDGAEPVFTNSVAYDFVANNGFPAADAYFDTNTDTRVVHYMGDGCWAWTNIHNNTSQWVDIPNMASVIYDVTGTSYAADSIGDKWSALVPIGKYSDPALMGEFFLEKRYNSVTSGWSDFTTTRGIFTGGQTQTFVEPTFSFRYSRNNHAPSFIPADNITNTGTGYTNPVFTVSAPDLPGGVQAVIGDYTLSSGRIFNVIFTEKGSGYTTPITVTVSDPNGTGFACNPIVPVNTVGSVELNDPNRVLRPINGYPVAVPLKHTPSFGVASAIDYTPTSFASLNPLAFTSKQYAGIDNKIATTYSASVMDGQYSTSPARFAKFNRISQAHYLSKYEISNFGAKVSKHYAWDKISNLQASWPRIPIMFSDPEDLNGAQSVVVEDTGGTGYIVINGIETANANNSYDSGKTYMISYTDINGGGTNIFFDFYVYTATYDSGTDQFTLRDQIFTDQHIVDASSDISQRSLPWWSAYVAAADNLNTWMFNVGKVDNTGGSMVSYYTTDAGVTFSAVSIETDLNGAVPQWNSANNCWVSWSSVTSEIATSPNINGPWTVVATDLAGFLV